MKQRSATVIAIGLILGALMGYPEKGFAEVDVNIGIGLPLPPIVIPAPPPVLLIPSTYVYFVPDIDVDILFYHGYWYRPYKNHYYRATSYNGPWVAVAHGSVPRAVLHVPSTFRHIPPGQERIPYGELKKNWKIWEKEKHWDKQAKLKHSSTGEGRGKDNHKQGKTGGKGNNKN